MLDLGLTGKVAIVTGGSEGLGRAAAMRFAQEGCHVVICARRKDVLERAAEAIRKQTGVQVLAQVADVTRPADVEDLHFTRRRTLDGHIADLLWPSRP